MKRLLRWAFNFAAVVSAVLFVAVCVVWVRSYWWSDSVRRLPESASLGHSRYELSSSNGEVRIERFMYDTAAPGETTPFYWHPGLKAYHLRSSSSDPILPRNEGLLNRLGFDVGSVELPPGGTMYWLTLPYYVLTIAAPTPALVVVRRRTRRSRAPGLCPRCGYDLRATPDRCPECGAVPSAKGVKA